MDDRDINERIKGLEDYLKNLLNDKLYHHYSLFKFIQLKPELEKSVQKYQTVLRHDNETFEDMRAFSRGHDMVVDESKPFVRYTFLIERQNGYENEKISEIRKRFSEFR